MDISFHPSIPPSRSLPPFTTSQSLTTSPFTSSNSDQLHITNMRRTVSSASHLASSPATAASGSLVFEDADSLPSAHVPSIPPLSAEASIKYRHVSAHAHWPGNDSPIERAEGADEDDYAWYFRNPHRYIRRPRPGALRYKNNILTGTDSRCNCRNGDGDGTEVNMRLFATYLERHYSATPLSATFNFESEPTSACAAVAQAGTSKDRSRAGGCDGARNLQGDQYLDVTEEMAHSDDGASTIFSSSVDDWDAPTLTSGSLRNSKISCDMQRSSCDAASAANPSSAAALLGSSYVEVGAAFEGSNDPKISVAFSPSSWDFGSPSKLIGTSYVEVAKTDCHNGGAPGTYNGGHRSQSGAKDSTRSSSFFRPTSKHIDAKDRGVSQAQRFSLLRIFSS